MFTSSDYKIYEPSFCTMSLYKGDEKAEVPSIKMSPGWPLASQEHFTRRSVCHMAGPSAKLGTTSMFTSVSSETTTPEILKVNLSASNQI